MTRTVAVGVEPTLRAFPMDGSFGHTPRSFAPIPATEQLFGDYVRQELLARKWSVRYLALRSGVNHSTISRLLQGNRTPRLQTLMRIQAAFARRDRSLPGNAERWADPLQRVREALNADPALDVHRIEQVVRYYGSIRASQPTFATAIAQPASIRRVTSDRVRR